MKQVVINIGTTPIRVTFKPIKNLHLSVHPPLGEVTISSPLTYDLEKIKIYASTKLNWIKREQKKIQSQARESQRLFINKESHYLFGERYLLEVKLASKNEVERTPKKLILHLKDPSDYELKKATLLAFYRSELRQEIEKYLALYSKKMNLELPEFKIRKMKTNWGSCSPSKLLTFNLELARKPLPCIEYIVVHEMVHLIERHHNKNFVILMNKYLPNWQLRKQELNELPLAE